MDADDLLGAIFVVVINMKRKKGGDANGIEFCQTCRNIFFCKILDLCYIRYEIFVSIRVSFLLVHPGKIEIANFLFFDRERRFFFVNQLIKNFFQRHGTFLTELVKRPPSASVLGNFCFLSPCSINVLEKIVYGVRRPIDFFGVKFNALFLFCARFHEGLFVSYCTRECKHVKVSFGQYVILSLFTMSMVSSLIKFLNLKKLLLVVFVTGAAVLVIEVSATRILASYFGNTLYSFSSIISTVLGALSLGYYYGGRMADKNPSRRNFYLIILYSGVSVLLLYVLSLFVLPILGFLLSPVFGPLVASLALFFIPSLLLGMLSPFAIKLQSENAPVGTIGTISGEVFFWSTLGSIGGSLISGFFLIPSFGVDVIMVGLALALITMGVVGVGVAGISKNAAQNIGFLVFSALVVTFMWWQGIHNKFLVVNDGIYEKLYVYDSTYEGKPTRFFVQDTTASGAMNIEDGGLAYEYTKYYDAHRVFNSDIKRALVIGGGIYSVPKQLLVDIPDIRVDVAEIEPSLYGLAKKYFGLKDDPRLSNYIVDGRRFLHDSTDRYDFIFTDAYKSLYSMPVHLTTKEFFETANNKLASGGVFIANIIGSLSPQAPSFTLSEMRTFRSVFPNSYFFATKSPKSTEPQNLIFIGLKNDQTPNFNSQEVLRDRNPLVRSLGEKMIDMSTFDFSQYTIFTDNYAPVEYYGARFLADVALNKNK